MGRLFTSESVSYGHPDKIADIISDAIVDALLTEDPNSKVAVETMVKDNTVVLGGEVTSNAIIDYKEVVKDAVKGIGYSMEHGFHPATLTIINLIGAQSPEINGAVVMDGEEVGAGDQGVMCGMATNETDNYMPLEIHIAKKIINSIMTIGGLGPDIKSQVTVEINDDGSKRIHTILVSSIHTKAMEVEEVRDTITKLITGGQCGLSDDIMSLMDDDTKIVINPAGRWVEMGGPVGDAGITGRKIVVDQFGPSYPVGGGAFSGKDFSKVDRSGAYLARYIAKNIVGAGIVPKCVVEISYMIGVAEPSSIHIDTFGKYEDDVKLTEIIRNTFPMTPRQIVNHFDLTKPIFMDTAKNGHFGRTNLPWEQLDKVDELKSLLMTENSEA
jgi:S-adenosylmethionine synthetase